MKIPLSLIQSFLPLSLSPIQIGETLTLLGIEVDQIENASPSFAKVVVVEIAHVQKHPNAQNLCIAEVNDGKKTHTVVCADLKCRAGMKSAFAPIGAILTDADGKQRRIEKSLIRGVESHGMLCSGSELRISQEEEGILDLPSETPVGEDIAHLYWDPIFELSLTPNLGHCMSALGIARELSAALQIPIERPKVTLSPGKIEQEIHIQNLDLCSRYMCCLIEDVQVGPSPFWLKRQLEAMGQKSINNIVDITNYIMMKTGQPLHAFDADLLEGKVLEIAPSKSAQKFLCLDGVERQIPAHTLLIYDSQKPIAIAGIMGGENTAVSAKTTKILLEAAHFNPTSIRSTSKKMGLRTESSQRFDKGVDPTAVDAALFEAAKQMGGRVIGYKDVKASAFEPKQIHYRTDRINQILGTKLSETEVEQIFTRLHFQAKNGKATIPLYRTDLIQEIDLVEEVARIYGYNHIEKKTPRITTSEIPNDPVFLFENEMRKKLSGLGLFEFLNCDLISPKLAEIAKAITPTSMGFLESKYSKSEEYSILRTSLLPALLESLKHNLSQKNNTVSAFEIGRIHFLQSEKPVEIPMLAIMLTGKSSPAHWSYKNSDYDFFDLKGVIENLLFADFIRSGHITFHPQRQADIQVDKLTVGSLGEIHPSFLEKFDIAQRVFYAELNLFHLLKLKKTHLKMNPLPQFPSSERDWTLPLPLNMPIDLIFQEIEKVQSSLLQDVVLIDLYIPEHLEQKNATFRMNYRDSLKTISLEEVENEHSKITKSVIDALNLQRNT